MEQWISGHRARGPLANSTTIPDIGQASAASLERTVAAVADLHDATAPLELIAARILAVLAGTSLGHRTTMLQTDAANVAGLEVEWQLSNGAFGIDLREMDRGVSVSVSPVNDIDEISLLLTIASTVQAAVRERGSSDAHDLWPASKPPTADQRVFQSTRMVELLNTAGRLAAAKLPVLVTGETGTGKEVLARLIHEQSPVRSGPFVPFNCSALPRELVESQLFGHRKGSFTGAVDSQIGIIRSAEGGMLFLDEVGDLDPVVQPKLLRFLESGEIQPVGEPRSRQVSVRIVAATNVDLEELVAQGRFREDLFYRIGVAPVLIPPLRERKDEIPTLAALFLDRYGRECERRGVRLSDECVAALLLYDWPGNIRQLANELRRVVAMAKDGQIISPQDLAPQIARAWRDRPAIQEPAERPTVSVGLNQDLASAVAELEEKLIEHALDVTGGHVSEAARLLGLSRKGLFLKRRRRGLLRDAAV